MSVPYAIGGIHLRHRDAPILVVGAPRSGTTWLGKMLALPDDTYGLYEPFNPDGPRPPSASYWPYRRKVEYVTWDNEWSYLLPTWQVLHGRLPVEHFLRRMTQRRFQQWREEALPVVRAKLGAKRIVAKDSTSVFYAHWLAARFGVRIVVILRHPGGTTAGYKRMGWMQDMSFILEQPLLMRDLLEPYRDDIERWNHTYRAGKADPVDMGILWWRLSMHAAATHLEHHADWIAVRHEDLSANPTEQFPELYRRLGLAWSPDVAARAVPLTRGSGSSTGLGSTMHVLERTSRSTIGDWKDRLEPAEVDRMLRATEPEAKRLGLDLE